MNIEGLLLPRGGSSYAPSYLMIVFFLGKKQRLLATSNAPKAFISALFRGVHGFKLY